MLFFSNLMLLVEANIDKSGELEKLLLLKPANEGMVKLEELTPYLGGSQIENEISQWLTIKEREVENTAEKYRPLLIDDIHRKLLRFIRGYDARRKWADFQFEMGLAHDSDVAISRDGEALPSGESSVRRDISLKGEFEGRDLPWGKARLKLGVDSESYERSIVENYGSTVFNAAYEHEFSFFRPSFYKNSRSSLALDYTIGDRTNSQPLFYSSVRPKFELFDKGGRHYLKPDLMSLEVEFRQYGSSYETGVLGESKNLTGITLAYEWDRSFRCYETLVDQRFTAFVRNYKSDAEEMNYSTLAFGYVSLFDVGLVQVEPGLNLQKNFSQEYNHIGRDDLILRLGLKTSADVYKKIVKIILAFDWEDRQSDHSSFDYNHEIFYLGFQCHW
jgi:hypothetical protein